MDRYKYIHSLIDIIPQEIIEEYNLITKVRNGFVMYEIWRVMYGLSQSDILEKKLPKTWISEAGYGPCKFMPVLWKKNVQPLNFFLMVDDPGIKCIGENHAENLIKVLQKYYTCAIDWEGTLYCGFKITWYYKNKQLISICLDKYKKYSKNFSTPLLNTQNNPHTNQR